MAKYRIDVIHDPKKYWQVFDRTLGIEVDDWSCDGDGVVTISNASKFHVYTVNFLVYQTWDSTSMYNHVCNNWKIDPIISVDPYDPAVKKHLFQYFDNWLAEHPKTDIVRLTTLAYHFVLDSDKYGNDKFRDWTGYMDTVTIDALKDFEKQFGYALTSEDFVDQGYYNAIARIPSQKYCDWMSFIHEFVIDFGKELVNKIHMAGKKAAIFQGDHWAGVEPYGKHYDQIGIDINVGACEDGVALRRLADCPAKDEIKEIRLYPYFFPDSFNEDGNPVSESINNWIKIRRAMLRQPVDRIGYGGYLSLAAKHPDFIEHTATICKEFRTIRHCSGQGQSYKAPIKVAILNSWGKYRSWLNNFGRDQKFLIKCPDVVVVAGSNLLESLAGLPVEVSFISFAEIEKNGIPKDIDVLINEGEHSTSWSGGKHWLNEKIITRVRQWIYQGGSFLGALEPSAYHWQGHFFQLSDVLGVDKEIGQKVMQPP